MCWADKNGIKLQKTTAASGGSHLFIESAIHICTIDWGIECEIFPVFPFKLFKLTIAWCTVPFKSKQSINHLPGLNSLGIMNSTRHNPLFQRQQDISDEQDLTLAIKAPIHSNFLNVPSKSSRPEEGQVHEDVKFIFRKRHNTLSAFKKPLKLHPQPSGVAWPPREKMGLQTCENQKRKSLHIHRQRKPASTWRAEAAEQHSLPCTL